MSKEVLPDIPLAKEIIYATATSVLFHLAVVSPHKLKPSYFKFMNKITGNRYYNFMHLSDFLKISLVYSRVHCSCTLAIFSESPKSIVSSWITSTVRPAPRPASVSAMCQTWSGVG